jgi:hypothetical protein
MLFNSIAKQRHVEVDEKTLAGSQKSKVGGDLRHVDRNESLD